MDREELDFDRPLFGGPPDAEGGNLDFEAPLFEAPKPAAADARPAQPVAEPDVLDELAKGATAFGQGVAFNVVDDAYDAAGSVLDWTGLGGGDAMRESARYVRSAADDSPRAHLGGTVLRAGATAAAAPATLGAQALAGGLTGFAGEYGRSGSFGTAGIAGTADAAMGAVGHMGGELIGAGVNAGRKYLPGWLGGGDELARINRAAGPTRAEPAPARMPRSAPPPADEPLLLGKPKVERANPNDVEALPPEDSGSADLRALFADMEAAGVPMQQIYGEELSPGYVKAWGNPRDPAEMARVFPDSPAEYLDVHPALRGGAPGDGALVSDDFVSVANDARPYPRAVPGGRATIPAPGGPPPPPLDPVDMTGDAVRLDAEWPPDVTTKLIQGNKGRFAKPTPMELEGPVGPMRARGVDGPPEPPYEGPRESLLREDSPLLDELLEPVPSMSEPPLPIEPAPTPKPSYPLGDLEPTGAPRMLSDYPPPQAGGGKPPGPVWNALRAVQPAGRLGRAAMDIVRPQTGAARSPLVSQAPVAAAAGRAALQAPYQVARDTLLDAAVPSAKGQDATAYASPETTHYALSAVLSSGQTGLPQRDEEEMTSALVSGDSKKIRAADYRLRMQHPGYARAVERELRSYQED